MTELGGSQIIPIQLSQNCAVASIQVDLTPEVILNFRKQLLEFAHKTGAIAVILDVSGVNIMDLDDFNLLKQTMSMVKILGAIPVLSGLNPGVVASIIDLGANVDDIYAALNLDESFKLIRQIVSSNSKF